MTTSPTSDVGGGDDDRVAIQLGSPHRLNAIIDGVYAIIMTILVLDLKVPDGLSASDTTADIYALAPRIFAFLVSFGIVASLWVYPHTVSPLFARSNTTHVLLNLTALMFASLIPFCASVMGSLPDSVLGPEIYALIVTAQHGLHTLDLAVSQKTLIPKAVSRRLIYKILRRVTTGGILMGLIGLLIAPRYPKLALLLIVIHFAMFWWVVYSFAGPINRAVHKATMLRGSPA